MPPFLSDRPAIEIIPSRDEIISTDTNTNTNTGKSHNTNNDAITQASSPYQPQHNIIAARSSSPNPSTTIGIVLGSLAGFLFFLTLVYVCYFRHYSTMYIVSRRSSATSSKASQKSRRRRKNRRQPIIAGLPRPREVIIVDVLRTRTSVPAAAAPAAVVEPAAEPEAPAAEAAAEG